MIVYVESNFVLELALEQEQYASCDAIVTICESGEARLVIPAFCIAEPYETLGRRAIERGQLKISLANELKLLSRSQSYKSAVDTLQYVTEVLIGSGKEENRRLHEAFERILKISEIVPLEQKLLAAAAKFQSDLDLKPPDSIVYASVLQHLATADVAINKCFLNRNSKDFDNPDIEAALNSHGCKLLFRFDSGFNYIQSQIRSNAVT